MIQLRWEVRLVTQMKDGCVYQTCHVCFIWVRAGAAGSAVRQQEIAKRYRGDMLRADSKMMSRTVPNSYPEIEVYREGDVGLSPIEVAGK